MAACDPDTVVPDVPPLPGMKEFISDTFDSQGAAWGQRWLNVRYESQIRRARSAGIIEVPPAVPKAIAPGKDRTEYLAQPVIVADIEVVDDAIVSATLSFAGAASGGVIAMASFDEAYALLIEGRRALLCRYTITDRTVLARRKVPAADRYELGLSVADGGLTAEVVAGARTLTFQASDPDPLTFGFAGVVANPTSDAAAGEVEVTSFSASSTNARPPEPRFAYRFAGAIVQDSSTYRVRVAARTVIPAPISFEVDTDPGFTSPTALGPFDPEGRLGSVRTWLEGLEPDTEHHWRPVAGTGDARVEGPPARFRTPPAAGAPVRFVFASCTSGRVTAYPSFATARDLDPDLYIHAGDWGYADLTSVDRRGDHFQARWIRLLREHDIASLLDQTPLLFWQDDHDYQADNGWSQTVQAYAVTAFDEIHANPDDDFFDVRYGDVHIWCLDCRLHATDPKAPDGPKKSRIGNAQKKWLKAGMEASDAPVKIVGSAMVFRNKPDDDPGWHNVYTHERDELLGFFASLDATVLILSGDSHGQRLIHHFEFGELYEANCSGTDFPGGDQGNNDPEHTLVNINGRSGFAFVELDAAGPDRMLTVRSVASDDGSTLFEKSLPVR